MGVGLGLCVRVRGVQRCHGRANSPAAGSGGDIACRSGCGWGVSGCRTSWGRAGLTWDPFSLVPFMIGLALAADVALAVENSLNVVIVSDHGR